MLRLDRDAARWAELSRLLGDALELAPAARERWLASLPAETRDLVPRLRALLARAASPERGSPLDTLPKLDDGTVGPGEARDGSLRPGAAIGPYRLVRRLGEGGMGAVWLAERADGLVRRPLALKLPRGAPAGAGLAERMAREREILASLDHPNIARLYDAGVTPEGQPWLALEYVEGRPIDVHLRQEGPGLRGRLQLFLQVARAVAHAHARLVVHRDLKPANVLVTADGQVRLLDFGIAKLLDEGEAGESELTLAGGRALTPAYASPEQLAGRRIGVASDVYSLGVLLYEMLAGARPYRVERASPAAIAEAVLRQEPARPSEVAREPGLRRALRGDLDTIVLKALRKAPEARYSSVEALAGDVERHLEGRVVLARPEGLGYRLRKLVGRHRLAAGASSLAVLAVLGGAGAALWQAREALAEKRRAVEVKAFLVSILEEADPYVAGKTLTAADLLARAQERIDRGLSVDPVARAEILAILGTSLVKLQNLEGGRVVLRQARDAAVAALGADHPSTLRVRVKLVDALRLEGRTDEARRELEGLLPALRRAGAPEDLHEALLQAVSQARSEGREADAVSLAGEALALATARFGEHDARTVTSAQWLAWAYIAAERRDAAIPATERALRLTLALVGGDPAHPRAIQARLLLGSALTLAGERARALQVCEEAVRDARRVFGPESTVVAYALPRLTRAQLEAGRVEDAVESSRESVRLAEAKLAPGSPSLALWLELRGRALLAAGRAEEALPDLDAVVEGYRRTRGPSHPTTLAARRYQALALARGGRARDALAALPAAAPGDGAEAVSVADAVRRLAAGAAAAPPRRGRVTARRGAPSNAHDDDG